VPREGARITRQRRMAMDGRVDLVVDVVPESGGPGRGSSQLEFDQLIEPGG
jgi:hypothetical protein